MNKKRQRTRDKGQGFLSAGKAFHKKSKITDNTPLSPIVLLFLILLISLTLSSCNAKAPVISSIDPKIGRMGEIVTLTGSNFGTNRDESYVTIAGVAPTSSSYYMWQDNQIILKIPELGESGLVFVNVKGKKSNGVLFSNSATVPRPIEGDDLGLEPRITSVTPQTGAPGTLIVISGTNFGTSRENALTPSGVFFSWDYDTPFNPYIVREPEFIEVSEPELGYESWTGREIQVRIPDGAVSGNLEVRTNNGRSRPIYFDVSGKPGNKLLTDKRSYTISYSVDVRILEATRPNNLYLWMPKPVTSPSQRNINLVSRSIDPFVENHKGVSLFKLDNLATGTNHSITLTFHIEVYTVETEIRPLSIKRGNTPVSAFYSQNTQLIPANEQVKTAVFSITGREQNPYLKAKAIYDWVISNIQITETMPPASDFLSAALEQKAADSHTLVLLYTAMMRAADIPCIPAAGVLIDRGGKTIKHYWTEFWIDDFGWIPVDPVLGAGAVPETFESKQDLANYYFGNMDNRRITFSRGELNLNQIENRGRIVSHTQSYSLQDIWEEATGGLESYTSLWGDITISGIYAQ